MLYLVKTDYGYYAKTKGDKITYTNSKPFAHHYYSEKSASKRAECLSGEVVPYTMEEMLNEADMLARKEESPKTLTGGDNPSGD